MKMYNIKKTDIITAVSDIWASQGSLVDKLMFLNTDTSTRSSYSCVVVTYGKGPVKQAFKHI